MPFSSTITHGRSAEPRFPDAAISISYFAIVSSFLRFRRVRFALAVYITIHTARHINQKCSHHRQNCQNNPNAHSVSPSQQIVFRHVAGHQVSIGALGHIGRAVTLQQFLDAVFLTLAINSAYPCAAPINHHRLFIPGMDAKGHLKPFFKHPQVIGIGGIHQPVLRRVYLNGGALFAEQFVFDLHLDRPRNVPAAIALAAPCGRRDSNVLDLADRRAE
nr:MAG TPA: hypothetical protein [Caudoviricetes sp.]